MVNRDLIKLPNNVLQDLKEKIKHHINDDPKMQPSNFQEVATIIGINGYTRLNQLQKIVTWFNESGSNDEDRQKKEMYGKLLNFARQYLAQKNTNDKIKNKIRRMTAHVSGTDKSSQSNNAGLSNREVDRMNNVSSGSRAAITPAYHGINNYDMVTEQINRINDLINY